MSTASARIVVLGSANMDLVVTTPRHPLPGETVTGSDFTTIPGGKGANQAIAAARAGATVMMLGAVGDDDHGRRLRATLADSGVDVTGLSTVAQPSGTAHITVSHDGENSIIVVPGANGTLAALTDHHRTVIAEADWLVMQLELPLALVADAARAARANATTTILTPAPAVELPDDLLSHVDLLVPNQHEAALLTGHDNPEDAAAALRTSGVDTVLITLGAEGVLHADETSVTRHPAMAIDPTDIVDTTAAGDTFVGFLVAALAAGDSITDGISLATTAAGLTVQRAGASTSMPTRAEVDALRSGHGD